MRSLKNYSHDDDDHRPVLLTRLNYFAIENEFLLSKFHF